jgi:hypothetical protein
VEQAHRLTATSLGYNILAIQQQLMGTASLIKEMSARRTSVTDSTHCINNKILCSGKKDIDHTSNKSALSTQIRISVDLILHMPSLQIYLPVEFISY